MKLLLSLFLLTQGGIEEFTMLQCKSDKDSLPVLYLVTKEARIESQDRITIVKLRNKVVARFQNCNIKGTIKTPTFRLNNIKDSTRKARIIRKDR